MGHAEIAEQALARALSLARALGYAVIEAESLRTSAELAHARGDGAGALARAHDALTILERLGAEKESRALRDWMAAIGG